MKKLLLLVLSLSVVGCATTERVEVQPPSAPFVPAVYDDTVVLPKPESLRVARNDQGDPVVVTKEAVQARIRTVFDGLRYDRIPRVTLQDNTYAVVEHESMVGYIRWAQEVRRRLGFNYVANKRDCENFAKMLASTAHFVGGDDGNLEAQILIGVFWVKQKKVYARVPRGGTHVLVWFYSDRGLHVAEPQVENSVVHFSEYPNRKYVLEGWD